MARSRTSIVALAAALLVVGSAWGASAQLLPTPTQGQTQPTLLPPPTSDPAATSTTAAGETTTTTATDGGTGEAPSVTDPPQAPAGAPEAGAEGGEDGTGLVVPSEAQAVMASVRRTAPNDNRALVDGARQLEALGVSADEAVRAAFGRFPVAGFATWSDDWLLPRWTGPLFRYHLGCDVMAAYGTPLRAVADGVVHVSSSDLGGLSVRLVQPDGTFFYYAHLSAVPDGIEGAHVTVGDLVGYVGDSGNAKGTPHLHFAIHPGGGAPSPPKPTLDQWVAEAEARLPELMATLQPEQPRPLVATALLRQLADSAVYGDATRTGPAATELLFASSANPMGGGIQLVEATVAAAARGVDWQARAVEQEAFELAWRQEAERARALLDPLGPAGLFASRGNS
jgi:murein DD-endopeptidase MepM/ murein hydrolase activator NlpD